VKATPAIVESAFDIDHSLAVLAVALGGMHDAARSAARHEQLSGAARATEKLRRLEVGRELLRARSAWPARGPNAKGWGEYLMRATLAESTARRYLDEARDPDGFARKQETELNHGHDDADDDDDTAPRRVIDGGEPPPFRQLSEDDLIQFLGRLDPVARKRVLAAGKANAKGGSGEDARGTWCTSKEWAEAVGPWDLDPFSNPRSKIASARRCMLEDGGDGFGAGDPGATPGLYLTGNAHGMSPVSSVAGDATRVWIQPPYELVEEAIAHYGHTRFCALLRWSPDVKSWFPALWARTAVVCHPFGARMGFDPPPGVEASGDMPFPHALYYADERDITDAVRARCIVWRVDHDLDPATPPALHIVK
jgi:hypothetical protein